MGLPELELHAYHRNSDPKPKPDRPRVRLPKMVSRFVRVAELLRYLVVYGHANPLTVEVSGELARRGVLDRVGHFERYKGAIRLTIEGKALVHESKSYLLDWGLATDQGRGNMAITRDGRATLKDWDDTTSECIYGNAR